MQVNTLKISGPKGSLEELRKALLAEPQAAQFVVTDATPEPQAPTPGAVRVRQPWELSEAIWMFSIELPTGVIAAMIAATAYDWLRAWLKSRADTAQVRVQELPASSAPSVKGKKRGAAGRRTKTKQKN